MVNIIMPVYNTDRNLFMRAVYSTLTQTKKCLLTVVDDCSDEEYSKDYQNILNYLPVRVQYHKMPVNVGPGVCRQWGIDNGYQRADYVAFLDADDILLPHFVELTQTEALKNDADIVYSDIRSEGKARVNDTIEKLGDNTQWLHGKLYKREFLKKYNIGFLPMLRYNEDVYFNIVCSNLATKRAYVERETYVWHYNKQSLTRRMDYRHTYDYGNYQYALAQIYAIGHCAHHNTKENLGTVFGQLYFSYEYQQEIDLSKIAPLQKAIIENLSNSECLKEMIKSDVFMERMVDRAKCGLFGKPFHESLWAWFDWIKEVINGNV